MRPLRHSASLIFPLLLLGGCVQSPSSPGSTTASPVHQAAATKRCESDRQGPQPYLSGRRRACPDGGRPTLDLYGNPERR